jgi:hypothetical protein
MTINATWHKANRMPKNPTADQRIHWHLEHTRECGCRPIPPKLRKEIERRRMKIAC